VEWAWFIFLFAVGACVGSFLNVVIHRLPRGQSIVFPGSHCPRCGRAIRWYDNIPVVSWLALGAKCRWCKLAIPARYIVVEMAAGLRVAGLYACYYMLHVRQNAGAFEQSWPMFAAQASLLCGLLACAIIDAEYWIVPLEVCWVVSIIGVGAAAAAPHPFVARVSPAPCAMAAAAVVGLLVAVVLLRKGLLQRSFVNATDAPVLADRPSRPRPEQTPAVRGLGDMLLAPLRGVGAVVFATLIGYVPWNRSAVQAAAVTAEQGVSPRKEVLRELLFLLPAVALAVGAYFVVRLPAVWDVWTQWTVPARGGAVAEHVSSGLSAVMGYLVAGGMVWGMRIVGTLGFGKEAMGMGDVHLLAAVGAVTGWVVPAVGFFVAPFFALAWALYLALAKGQRELPYGPWLAAGAMFVMVLYDPIAGRLAELFAPLLR
jgi:leader peptidase (prepilin peptidase)/N-methyltransferase